MANRAKKNTSKAITKLKQHLHNDRVGNSLLAQIERYVGSLRQSQSGLREEVAIHSQRAEGRLESFVRAKDNLIDAQEQLRHETSLRQQAESSVVLCKQRIARMEQKEAGCKAMIEQEVDQAIEGESKKSTAVRSLMKNCIARIKNTPAQKRPQKAIMFEIDDLVQDYSKAEYERIGMIVCLFASLGFPIGCMTETPVLSKVGDKTQYRFCRWSRDIWAQEPAWKNKIYDKCQSSEINAMADSAVLSRHGK